MDGLYYIMNEILKQANQLGTAAFSRGAMRVPAQDIDLQPLFEGIQVGQANEILIAWLRAWDIANLADRGKVVLADNKAINKALKTLNRELAKLDTYSDHIPATRIANLVSDLGFDAEHFEGIYCGVEGRVNLDIGHRCYVLLSWYRMEVSGRYEITTYAHKG
jgi:hypothetical protein